MSASVPKVRLSTWIRLTVFASVFSTMVALLLVIDHFAQSYALLQTNLRLQQLAAQTRDTLDRGLQERLVDMQLLRAATDPPNGITGARMRHLLESLQDSQPAYAWIGFTNPHGRVLAATGGLLEGEDVSQRPWFQHAKTRAYTGDYHPATLLEKKLPPAKEPWRFIDVALPLFNSDGQLRGVVGSHLSWHWARELAEQTLDPAQNHYGVEVFILRKDGLVLLGPSGFEETTLNTPSTARARSVRTEGAIAETWPDGKYITGYTHTNNDSSRGLGWIVLVRQPAAAALQEFDQLEHRVIGAGAAVAVLLTLIAIYFARRLANPLTQLTNAIEKHATDDTETEVPLVYGYHEAYVLAATLRTLVGVGRAQRHALRRLNESLENAVDARTGELRAAADQLQRALLEQHVTKETLRESEAELRAILQHARDAFIAIDEAGRVIEWNIQAEQLFGWSLTEVIGRNLAELIVPEAFRERHNEGMQRFLKTGDGPVVNQRTILTAIRRDGSELPVEVTIAHVPRQDGHMFIAFLHDISERLALQASLEQMAWRDALTGLPNRRAFLDTLPKALARTQRSGNGLALLFIDLDGFKGVNDTYGHDAGDALLRQFAARISACVRNSDTVARLAGDEFTVILEQISRPDQAREVAAKLLGSMNTPFDLGHAVTSLSSSIGLAFAPPGSSVPPEQLLSLADQAMYTAKRTGKNQIHVSVFMAAPSTTPD